MNIIELIKSRRTIRKFMQKPLTCEQLERYIDVARIAPSAANLQPLKYIAVQTSSMAESVFPLVRWAGYLENYSPKEGERPVAYVVVLKDDSICQNTSELDIGAAVENLILAALSEGVGSCWLGSVDKEKLSGLLDIPETLSISSVVALGYPKESPKEVEVYDGIKYFLDNETLCVPKRSLDDVLIKIV